MTIALVFLAGVAFHWAYGRFLMRLYRHFVAGNKVSRVQKQLFDKMGYESLLTFRAAVEAELAKRKGAAAS